MCEKEFDRTTALGRASRRSPPPAHPSFPAAIRPRTRPRRRVPKSYWIVITDQARGFRPAAQREDRVTQRQIIERFHRRSLRYWEETLELAGEAVEIGLEDRWTHVGRKFARKVAALRTQLEFPRAQTR